MKGRERKEGSDAKIGKKERVRERRGEQKHGGGYKVFSLYIHLVYEEKSFPIFSITVLSVSYSECATQP